MSNIESLVQDGDVGRSTPHVYQHGWAKVKDDHIRVGGASSQGLDPVLMGGSFANLQDLQEDEGVECQD